MGEVLKTRNIFGRDQFERSQALQCVIEIIDLFRNQLELIGGQILRQHSTSAIEDKASGWRNGFYAITVVQGLLCKQFIVVHLKLHEAGNHDAEQQKSECRCQCDT